MSENPLPDRFLTEREVDLVSGLSRGTRWKMSAEGLFPPKYRISPKKYAYRQSEILAWMDSRPATKNKSPSNYFKQKRAADRDAVAGGELVSAVGG